MVLKASGHVHAEEGADACGHGHAEAPHLHVEVQLDYSVPHLVL